jgi:hypothetical protein
MQFVLICQEFRRVAGVMARAALWGLLRMVIFAALVAALTVFFIKVFG